MTCADFESAYFDPSTRELRLDQAGRPHPVTGTFQAVLGESVSDSDFTLTDCVHGEIYDDGTDIVLDASTTRLANVEFVALQLLSMTDACGNDTLFEPSGVGGTGGATCTYPEFRDAAVGMWPAMCNPMVPPDMATCPLGCRDIGPGGAGGTGGRGGQGGIGGIVIGEDRL